MLHRSRNVNCHFLLMLGNFFAVPLASVLLSFFAYFNKSQFPNACVYFDGERRDEIDLGWNGIFTCNSNNLYVYKYFNSRQFDCRPSHNTQHEHSNVDRWWEMMRKNLTIFFSLFLLRRQIKRLQFILLASHSRTSSRLQVFCDTSQFLHFFPSKNINS